MEKFWAFILTLVAMWPLWLFMREVGQISELQKNGASFFKSISLRAGAYLGGSLMLIIFAVLILGEVFPFVETKSAENAEKSQTGRNLLALSKGELNFSDEGEGDENPWGDENPTPPPSGGGQDPQATAVPNPNGEGEAGGETPPQHQASPEKPAISSAVFDSDQEIAKCTWAKILSKGTSINSTVYFPSGTAWTVGQSAQAPGWNRFFKNAENEQWQVCSVAWGWCMDVNKTTAKAVGGVYGKASTFWGSGPLPQDCTP